MEFNLLFCGDVSLARRYEKLAVSRPSRLLDDVDALFSEAEIVCINLEHPLTYGLKKSNKSGPHLRAVPDAVGALRGVSLVSLANNHIYDYGSTGLSDTIKALKRHSIDYVGAGLDSEEVSRTYYKTIDGFTVAIVAMAEKEYNVDPSSGAGACLYDLVDALQRVKEAKSKSDFIVLVLHAGNEYFPCPRPALRKECRFLAENGVDVVVCHHSHLVGPVEEHNGKLIFYSLGNFLFDNVNPPSGWGLGIIVKLNLSSKSKSLLSYELIPVEQSYGNQGVKLAEASLLESFKSHIAKLSSDLLNSSNYEAEWARFAARRGKAELLALLMPFHFRGLGRLARFFPLDKILMPSGSFLARLNLIRNPSHRELIVAALEGEALTRTLD